MTSIRLASDNDYAKWDKFAQQNDCCSPYHLSAWTQAINQAYGHRCYLFIAEDNDVVVGILPLVIMAPPLLKKSICSLPFCDLGGVAATTQEAKDKLLTAALDFAASNNASRVELRQTAPRNQDHEIIDGAKVRMLLPLPDSAEALLASFKSKLRSQVKKAEKNGISYRSKIPNGKSKDDQLTDEDLLGFYQIMQINMRQLGSPVHSYKWFRSVLDYYGNNAVLGLVYFEDKIVGGAIILLCGKTVTVPWASTHPEYNRLAPNMLLYWGLLSYAADNGYQEFDFGRSTVGEGTFKFKKQWGAAPVPLDWLSYKDKILLAKEPATEPQGSDSGKGIRDQVAHIWSKLPVAITNFLGPIVRRYISL